VHIWLALVLGLRPVDGAYVDPLLDHFPQRAARAKSQYRSVDTGIGRITDLMSRSFSTVRTMCCTTKSISASVVNRPMPNRSDEWAMSSAAPKRKQDYQKHCLPLREMKWEKHLGLGGHRTVPATLMCMHCPMIVQYPDGKEA
jgi:hypothetical protein